GNYKTHYVYDASGNIDEIDDNNGNATGYTYDPLNRLTMVVDPQGYSTQASYTYAGQVKLELDKRGVYSRHDYDDRGYEIDSYDALNTAVQQNTHTDYYADGTVAAVTDPYSQVTRSYPSADPHARQVTTVDPLSITTVDTYDEAGNLVSQSTAGRTMAYQYD